MRLLICGLLVLLCAGCEGFVIGFAALPIATEKSIGTDDLLGAWQFVKYPGYESEKTVTVWFLPNGTFSQTITDANGVAKECQGGTWELSESWVHLKGYTSSEWGTVDSMSWYFIDAYEGGVVLFGGDDSDPDSFKDLKRIR